MDPQVALRPQRQWAGAWKLARAEVVDPQILRSVEWVKAHTAAIEAEPPPRRLRRLANEWADALAKRAVELHPVVGGNDATLLKRVWQDAETAALVLARATALWPAASRLSPHREQPTTLAGREVAAQQQRDRRRQWQDEVLRQREVDRATHTWRQVGSIQRCARCLQQWSACVSPCREDAPGARALIELTAAARQHGHVLTLAVVHYCRDRATPDDLPCLYCRSCGAWSMAATTDRCGLASLCRGKATRAGRQVLARVAKGLHPAPGRQPPFLTQFDGC